MSQRLHIVLSAPSMFGFMTGQPAKFQMHGFKSTLVSSPSDWLDCRAGFEGARRVSIPICRDISLFLDAITFVRLFWLFHRESPDAVILSGPKAIFLGGMAARLCSVPRTIAVYHGMRQENLKGLLRWILDLCDWVSFACADKVLAVSPSLKQLMLNRNLLGKHKVAVIGHGTANGVDPARFTLCSSRVAVAIKLKQALGIPCASTVVGFVGRITEDKGVADAYAAYQMLRETRPKLYLLFIGCNEMRTEVGRNLIAQMQADSQVRFVDYTDMVEDYMHILWAQIFASSREGFGMVIAEAAAMAIPTVAYDVTGVRDAIANCETGILVPYGDVRALAAALESYLNDPKLRRYHGLAGWHRVRTLYTPDQTWPAYFRALNLPASPAKVATTVVMSASEIAAFEERESLLR